MRLGHHQAQYAPSTRQPGTATVFFSIIAIKETVSQDLAQVPLVFLILSQLMNFFVKL